jgi:hypothetical protein
MPNGPVGASLALLWHPLSTEQSHGSEESRPIHADETIGTVILIELRVVAGQEAKRQLRARPSDDDQLTAVHACVRQGFFSRAQGVEDRRDHGGVIRLDRFRFPARTVPKVRTDLDADDLLRPKLRHVGVVATNNENGRDDHYGDSYAGQPPTPF